MTKSVRWLFVAVILMGLGACNTNTVRPLSAKEVATFVPAENPDKGYVVGSFAVQGDNPSKLAKMFGGGNFEYTGYYFFFRQTNAAEGMDPIIGSVQFDSRPMFGGKANSDFDVETGRGHVLVMPVAAGDYEFYRWRIYMNNGTSESSWQTREDYSIPFTIEPGKAMYIGEVNVQHTFGKNVFGMVIPSGGVFTCNDQFDRDLPLIKAEYSFMQAIETEHAPICEQLAGVYKDMFEESADEAE